MSTAPTSTTQPPAVLLLDLATRAVTTANPAARALAAADVTLPMAADAWSRSARLRSADGGPLRPGRSPLDDLVAGREVPPTRVRLAGDPWLLSGFPLPDGVGPDPLGLVVLVAEPSTDATQDAPAAVRDRAVAAAGWSFTVSDPRLPDHPLVWVNPAFARVTGYGYEESVGRNCRFLQGDDTEQEAIAAIREGIARRVHTVTTLRNYRRDGTMFHNEVSISPVFAADGELTHFVGVQADVTARVQAEEGRAAHLRAEQDARSAAEAAQRRLALLAEATTIMSAAPDHEDALRDLASLLVAVLADWCLVDLRDADAILRVAAVHRDPAVAPALATIEAAQPTRLGEGSATARVLAGGPPLLFRTVTSSDTASSTDDPDLRAAYHALGLGSVIVVPMRIGEQVLGTLMVGRRTDRVPLGEGDLDAMVDLGRRAALSVEHARLYRRERRAALELQVGLMPRPPRIAGLEVATRYLPGSDGARIGGDWYDAFTLPSGAVALSVGDVVGHDLTAAAAMSQTRSMLRAFAWRAGSPAAVLSDLDELVRGLEVTPLATAVYGCLALPPVPGAEAELTYAVAGHPPPFVVDAGGGVRLLDGGRSALLGYRDVARGEATATLAAGATLVLYTDGLVERRGSSVADGIERLGAALATAPTGDPESLCDAVLEAMGARNAPDDVALLAARVPA